MIAFMVTCVSWLMLNIKSNNFVIDIISKFKFYLGTISIFKTMVHDTHGYITTQKLQNLERSQRLVDGNFFLLLSFQPGRKFENCRRLCLDEFFDFLEVMDVKLRQDGLNDLEMEVLASMLLLLLFMQKYNESNFSFSENF